MSEPEHVLVPPAGATHPANDAASDAAPRATAAPNPVREIGGPPGPEPTRYGDWEKSGRCIDF